MQLKLATDHLLLDGQRFDWNAASIGDKLASAARLVAAASEPDHPQHDQARELLTPDALLALGRGLFAALFPAGSAQLSAYRATTEPLTISALGDLAELPWELLRDGDDWLAHSRGVIRRAGGNDSPRPLGEGPGEREFSVLVAVASPLLLPDDIPPDDPRQPATLDVDEQWQVMRDLSQDEMGLAAQLLPHATLTALDDALGEGATVLHLSAHGNVGRVLLEDENGVGVRVTAAELRAPIQRAGLRLAVLSSCLTAAQARDTASVAQVLIEAGVPMALAMRHSVHAEAARRFTQALYRELARGRDVNAAVCAARRRLWNERNQPGVGAWEWATPALYAREDAQPTKPLTSGRPQESKLRDPRPSLNLPELPGTFVGRRKEQVGILAALDWEHVDRRRVVALVGSGGVGKTALALTVTPRLAARLGSNGRVVFVAARVTLPPGELTEQVAAARAHALVDDEHDFLSRLAAALGADQPTQQRESGPLTEWITAELRRGKKTLLVLDNLESLAGPPSPSPRPPSSPIGRGRGREGEDEGLVLNLRDVLSDLPRQACALCTSRYELHVNETVVRILPLPTFDAALLARRYAAERGVDLTSQALATLVKGTRHPLMLRLTIARVAQLDAPNVAAALERLKAKRDELSERDQDFYAYVFEQSLSVAGEDGRTLFAALATFAAHARRDALSAALAWDDARSGAAMGHLVSLSLALEAQVWDGTTALLLEAPARAHAARMFATIADADDIAHRVAEWLLEYVQGCMQYFHTEKFAQLLRDDPNLRARWSARLPSKVLRMVNDSPDRLIKAIVPFAAQVAGDGLDDQRENVAGAIAWAHMRSEHRLLMDLTKAIHDYLKMTGHLHRLACFCEWALEAAYSTGDNSTIMSWKLSLAAVFVDLDEYPRARQLYVECESDGLLQNPDYRIGLASLRQNLGVMAQASGDYSAAMECYESSLKIYEALDNKSGVSDILHQKGIVMQLCGDYERALAYYQHSLEIAEDLGDWNGVNRTLLNMGSVAQARGDHDTAIDYFQRGLKVFEALGDQLGMSKCLNFMGNVAHSLGDDDAALSYYRRSFEIKKILDDRRGMSMSLLGIGNVARARGDLDAAMDCYMRSQEIFESLNDRDGAASCRTNMATLYEQLGDFDQALTFALQAEADFESIGALHHLAQAQQQRARIDAKVQLLKLVIAGCKGDMRAGVQAYDSVQMLQQPGAPPAYSALGKALQRLLEGLRDYDEVMQGLPPEVGPVVRQVLEQIGNR